MMNRKRTPKKWNLLTVDINNGWHPFEDQKIILNIYGFGGCTLKSFAENKDYINSQKICKFMGNLTKTK